MSEIPTLSTILLTREGRLLRVILNRPEVLNAVGAVMHRELVTALRFAGTDPESDVVLLTGAGRAFSAGGDLDHMANFAAHPELFDREAADAKRIVFALLEIEKPVIARVNGHAVGLGATLALLCDVIFAAETAKIGDPHVRIGLAAGDGGAVIWPQLIGFARAKEYLLTGGLIPAPEAARIGLINHALPLADLDARVEAFCAELLAGATEAIRYTKMTVNLELRRIATAAMDTGMGYEALTARSPEFRRRLAALRARDGG